MKNIKTFEEFVNESKQTYSDFKDEVLNNIKKQDAKKHAQVIDVMVKSKKNDRYTDYIFNSWENRWPVIKTSKGLLHMDESNQLEDINESNNEFMEMKRDIFGKAKKQYLDGIKSRLEKAGFKVGKIKAYYSQFDDFSSDTIDCTYKGQAVKLTMSISGASLGVSNLDIDGYTTKIAVLAKKIEKLLK